MGRNTIVYCKNGDIEIGENVSLSANCVVFSSNRLVMGKNSVVAAFAYLLSGGEYDLNDATPLALQKGTRTKGPLEIGEDCWIGAGAKVLDGASLGARVALGAGAVANKPIPANSIAVGVPARVVKARKPVE